MPPRGSKSKRKQSFESRVKEIVHNETKDDFEIKKSIIGYDNNTLNANIPSGDVTSSNNYMRLLGPITQISYGQAAGDQGQYNMRVGDEITLKHVDIKGFVSFNDLTINQQVNTRVGVRVMILKQKDENSDLGFVTNSHANMMLEQGLTATPGPSAFTGRPLNCIQSINRELYTVRYDKTFYLSQPLQFTTGTDVRREAGNTEHTLRFFQHKLRFGKNGLKLKFSDGNSDTANNFPYVMVMGYTNLVDSSAATNGQINVSMTSIASYTDA